MRVKLILLKIMKMKETNLNKAPPPADFTDISMVTVYDMGKMDFDDKINGNDRFTYQNDFNIELSR